MEEVYPGAVKAKMEHEVLEAETVALLGAVKSGVVAGGTEVVAPMGPCTGALIGRALLAIAENVGWEPIEDVTSEVRDDVAEKNDNGVLTCGEGLARLAGFAESLELALELGLDEVVDEVDLPVRVGTF